MSLAVVCRCVNFPTSWRSITSPFSIYLLHGFMQPLTATTKLYVNVRMMSSADFWLLLTLVLASFHLEKQLATLPMWHFFQLLSILYHLTQHSLVGFLFVWGFQRAILRRHKDGKRRCCVQRFWQHTSRVERRPDGPDSTDKIKKLLWNIKISPDAGISSQLLTLTCAKQLSPSWALICLEHWIHCRSPYEAFQVSFIRRSCTDTRVCSARRGLKSLLE